MTETAAHEATTNEEIQAWHDEAAAEYEAALEAFQADPSDDNKAAYKEAAEVLVAGTQYWRQVGEQTGVRTGIAIENDTVEG